MTLCSTLRFRVLTVLIAAVLAGGCGPGPAMDRLNKRLVPHSSAAEYVPAMTSMGFEYLWDSDQYNLEMSNASMAPGISDFHSYSRWRRAGSNYYVDLLLDSHTNVIGISLVSSAPWKPPQDSQWVRVRKVRSRWQ